MLSRCSLQLLFLNYYYFLVFLKFPSLCFHTSLCPPAVILVFTEPFLGKPCVSLGGKRKKKKSPVLADVSLFQLLTPCMRLGLGWKLSSGGRRKRHLAARERKKQRSRFSIALFLGPGGCWERFGAGSGCGRSPGCVLPCPGALGDALGVDRGADPPGRCVGMGQGCTGAALGLFAEKWGRRCHWGSGAGVCGICGVSGVCGICPPHVDLPGRELLCWNVQPRWV